MGIEASYRRISPEEFARLQKDPKAAEKFFGLDLESLDDLDDPEKLRAMLEEQAADERRLEIGKDWHALHFLLTDDGELKPHELTPPPLSNVVQGGTETPWECTYGHVRSLTPEEVRAVAEALKKISVADLRAKFSVEAFNASGIYPHGRRKAWTADEAETVFLIYPGVVKFFQTAAEAGDVVLLSSD